MEAVPIDMLTRRGWLASLRFKERLAYEAEYEFLGRLATANEATGYGDFKFVGHAKHASVEELVMKAAEA